MRRTTTILRRATRRIMLRTFIATLGPGLAISLTVGLAGAVADRLIGPGLPWWTFVAIPAGVAVAAAGIRAVGRRPPLGRAATEVDLHAHLADRLASALDLEQRDPRNPFTALAVEDAERHAETVRLNQTLPLRWGRSWLAWPLVGAGCVLAAMLWAPMHLLHDPSLQQAELERAAQRDAAEQELQDALAAIAPTPPPTPDVEEERAPGATPEELAALDRIREQLRSSEKTPDEARTEAARVLSEAADRLEREAQREEGSARQLSEMMRELEAPPLAPEGATPPADLDRLRDALRQQDLDRAMEALEGLDERLEAMTEEERAALEEQVDALANDLDELLQESAEQEQASQETADDRLRDHGLDQPQIEELREMARQRDIEQRLREEGFDEQAARRLSEEIAQENDRRDEGAQAEEEARELSDALRDAADRVRDPQPPEPSRGQDRQPPDQSQQGTRKEQGGQQGDQSQQGTRKEQGGQQGDQSQQGTREEQGGQQGDQSQQGTREPQGGQQGDQSQQGTREQQGGQQGDQSQQGTREQQGGQQGDQSQQGTREQQGGQQGDQSQQGSREPQGGQQGDQSQQGTREEQGGQPGEGGREGVGESQGQGSGEGQEGAFSRVRDRLEQMKEQQQSVARRRADAEQMRREADELLDGVSESERAEMERWARAMQREQGAADRPDPFESELVDARDPERDLSAPEGQKPIAEWYDPEADYRHDPLIAEGGELDAPIREAMRSADRAMEDNVIPRRFRNVQRYFELARQAAGQRDMPRPEPAPLAPEVNPD